MPKTAPAPRRARTAIQTRADRLDAILAKLAPKRLAAFKKSGYWTREHAASGDDPRTGAPYVISTTEGNGRRIVVTGDDGDSLAGVGATIEAALTHLEGKLK
jgi:hypothetical protein